MADIPYTTGEWCGYRQLRCKQCPYDVLDDGSKDAEAVIMEHIATAHQPAPPEPPAPTPLGGPKILIADKSGREVPPPVYEVVEEPPELTPEEELQANGLALPEPAPEPEPKRGKKKAEE